MIIALIGHRGAGKSAFLRRMEGYLGEALRPVRAVDLDEEITRKTQRSIDSIFTARGERAFRELESEVFSELVANGRKSGSDLLISVGAGFEGLIPRSVIALWVRRPTDRQGRVFLDRPRLNADVSPFAEYRERFQSREERYQARHDEVWEVGEGFDRPNEIEREFVLNLVVVKPFANVGGVLTLLPANFKSDFEGWIRSRLSWEGTRFEIRDDLLSAVEIEEAFRWIPRERILYSYRDLRIGFSEKRSLRDWAIENGKWKGNGSPEIYSLHERKEGESVQACGERLVSFSVAQSVLKLSVVARDFQDLLQGHQWAAEDPVRRAFLPRSGPESSGKWRWYRSLHGSTAPIAFFREGDGSSLDQPCLSDWLRARRLKRDCFAAVLGDPVVQSRTPSEQMSFFEERSLPIFSIPMSESEWSDGALDVLKTLGLRYAAVTSPLKSKAGSLVGSAPINTIFFDGTKWTGKNTDLAGLENLLRPYCEVDRVAVWGGGGTLETLSHVLPAAAFYSARSGQVRKGQSLSPSVLVWAVGRSRQSTWPSADWRPEVVVDLNYSEDSPGCEYALKTGAKYISGMAMFEVQAAGQREFWRQEEHNGR